MPDIAIIGGGAAGLTAGLYAARGGAEAVVYEELFAGGQAAKTSLIENYPGFPAGVEGFAIGTLMAEQAEKFGLTIAYDTVEAVDLRARSLRTGGGTVEAGAIILCMGASPRKLGLPREEALTGRGVSYCATCDGALFKDKDTAVVGGGDTALSDALYLSRLCRSVTLIHRRDRFRASAALVKAARSRPNIRFALDTVCTALLGDETLSGLSLRHVKSGEESALEAAGVFMAVGVEPRSALVAGQLPLAADGSVITNERMETGLPGVYAAG
ncbi:MAG: FAD-dependent oxidoreductase, partial [Clostridia bacterium]|nr:FAD-dependent oxidoreductase [Clostridia bacterium]